MWHVQLELGALWCNRAASAAPVPHTPGARVCCAQLLCTPRCHLLDLLNFTGVTPGCREGLGLWTQCPPNISLKSLSGAQSPPELEPICTVQQGKGRAIPAVTVTHMKSRLCAAPEASLLRLCEAKSDDPAPEPSLGFALAVPQGTPCTG